MGDKETDREVIRAAGIRWHLAPGASGLLTSASLNLATHLRAGNAKVIKNGPHRTVHRVALPDGTVFWKHCRIAGLRSWLRQCLRPPKARMEFDRAIALAARGIPTIEPLAWGVDEQSFAGESYLLTRELVGAMPLSQYLNQIAKDVDRPSARRETAVALGRFIAQLHNAGVIHPDLHAGNILVVARDGTIRFHLIDLHAVRIGAPLRWRARRDNLVVFNRWFINHASRADRCRFWHAYRDSCGIDAKQSDDAIREIEKQTIESNIAFRNGRDRRCTGTNRYFQAVRSGIARGFAVRDIDANLLQSLLDDPDGPFWDAGNVILKDSRTSTVAEITVATPAGPRPMIWKRFRAKKPLTAVLNRLRPSPALRAWQAGHAFRDRGLPTPRPWLVLHRRGALGPREGYLLCEKIEGALDLSRAVELCRKPAAQASEEHSPLLALRAPEAWWNAIAALARLIREMHDLGLSHRDLKAANILWDPRWASFQFIDLVGVGKHRRLSTRTRVKNLARLQVSFSQNPYLTRTDRLRFLSIYLGWAWRGRAGWKEWWKQIDAASRDKIEQNHRRRRSLA